MVSLLTIVVAVVVLAAAYAALSRWWLGLTARLGLPPGPVDGSTPLLGNAGEMVSRYRYFVLSSVAAYGDTWTAFFFEPVVSVGTHAGVTRMMGLEARGELVGGQWPNAWKRVFGATQLFAVSGARHQRMRSALAPSLAPGDRLDALVPVLSHRVRVGLDGWVRAGAATSIGLDVVPRLRLLAVAILTSACFGRPFDDRACAALLKLLDAMGDGFLVVLPADVPGSTMRSATAATRAVWAVVGAEVDAFVAKLHTTAAAAAADSAPAAASPCSSSLPVRQQKPVQSLLTPEERVCLLAQLLAVDLTDGGGRLSRQEVVENISMYLYHGTETLCTLLTTVTMYASHPLGEPLGGEVTAHTEQSGGAREGSPVGGHGGLRQRHASLRVADGVGVGVPLSPHPSPSTPPAEPPRSHASRCAFAKPPLNRSVLPTLQAELTAAGIDRDMCLTAANLAALPFLAACVTEALRVCPPVLGMYRATAAVRSSTVALGGGVTCRAGSTLAMSIYGACMDATAWTDAHLFRPERHLAAKGGDGAARAAPPLPAVSSSPPRSPSSSPASPAEDDRSLGSFGSCLTDASDTGGSSNDLTPPAGAARRGSTVGGGEFATHPRGGGGDATAPRGDGGQSPPRCPFSGATEDGGGGSLQPVEAEVTAAAATAAATATAGHPAFAFGTPARLCVGAALAPLVARVYLATLLTAYVPRLTTSPVMVETLPHIRPRFQLWLVPTTPKR